MMHVPEADNPLRTPGRKLLAIPIPVGALNLRGRYLTFSLLYYTAIKWRKPLEYANTRLQR